MLAAIVAAVVVPVGFALSLESEPAAAMPFTSHAVMTPAQAPVVASTVLVSTHEPATHSGLHPVPDAAKLFVVGTALFGLAAAVRKAA